MARKVNYCDDNATIISQNSVLSIPGYPNGYSGETNCYMRWLIKVYIILGDTI